MQTAWLVYFGVLGAGGLRSCPSDGLASYRQTISVSGREPAADGIFNLAKLQRRSDYSAPE